MKTKRKRAKMAKLLTNQQFLGNFRKNNRLGVIFGHNKRHLRANGLSLLPLALRPRLLGGIGKPISYTAFSGFFIPNRGRKLLNVVKIVVMTTILGVFGLFPLNFTDPVSAASLTLSVPTDTLKLDLQPNNTFSKSSASSVSVKTDAFAGYTLSIKAKNNNELVNGNNKIMSITGNLTEDQYKASGNTNTWGYQPSKFNDNGNTLFLPGPTNSLSTIEATKSKNDTANNYNFVIGSKVDNTISKGTYSNTFIFTAMANTVSYSITYNLNSGTWNGKSPQTGNTVENSIPLDSNKPSRTNYEFKGWCPQETHDETCGTTSYQPSNSYPLNNNNNTVTLWAMWKPFGFEEAFAFKGIAKQGSYYKMQDMTSEICNSIIASDIKSVATLIDVRDSTTYTVAKLKDGKCWMTENFRIMNKTINSTNSDMTSGSFTIPDSNLSAFNTTGKPGGWTNYLEDNIAYYGNNTSYGAYYSWYTATAGSGKKSMTTQGQNATDSICPKGWKLPTGGTDTNSDYQQLYKHYTTGAQLAASPANFTYAGFVSVNGSFSNRGSYGYYWSSTVHNNDGAYVLYFDSGGVYPAGGYGRPDGSSVRCVAR